MLSTRGRRSMQRRWTRRWEGGVHRRDGAERAQTREQGRGLHEGCCHHAEVLSSRWASAGWPANPWRAGRAGRSGAGASRTASERVGSLLGGGRRGRREGVDVKGLSARGGGPGLHTIGHHVQQLQLAPSRPLASYVASTSWPSLPSQTLSFLATPTGSKRWSEATLDIMPVPSVTIRRLRVAVSPTISTCTRACVGWVPPPAAQQRMHSRHSTQHSSGVPPPLKDRRR